MAAINLDIGGNTRRLDRDIQKTVNRVYTINLKTKGDQPLGRITGQVNEFNKSLDASNARVIAFGASAGIIFGVQRAFSALVGATIEVQKSLQDINVILNVSAQNLQKFGGELFSIAKNTGQSFQEVAKAATEFSRQGLGVEETLKRTSEALILSRLSGLDAAKSVEALTAAVNSYASQAVTATEVVNKFANVDAAFAVSSADLAEALQRVGSSAAQSGVSLNELIAIVTSAQQTTARGGAVIGNSFKTIFTRLQRGKVIDLLESLGISSTDSSGQVKSTIQLLQDLGKVYDNLGSQQQAYVAEQVGGVFQINILKAALADLGKEYSIYSSALNVAAGSTDQAIRRNEELNKTYAAQINALQENARQLAATAGERLLGPSIDRLVGGTNTLLNGFNESDGQGVGAVLGKGILDGIGQFISGPGLALIGGVLLKLFRDLAKFATGSVQQLLGLNTAATQQKDLQASISQILAKNPQLLDLALKGEQGLNTAANSLLASLQKQTVELQKQATVAQQISKAFIAQAGVRVTGGVPVVPTGRAGKAAGYIPNFAQGDFAREELLAASLGAKNPTAQLSKGTIDGKKFIKNNREVEITGFGSNGDSAVIPTYGRGFIPNFAGVTSLYSLAKGSKIQDYKTLLTQGGNYKGQFQKPFGALTKDEANQALARARTNKGQISNTQRSTITNLGKTNKISLIYGQKAGVKPVTGSFTDSNKNRYSATFASSGYNAKVEPDESNLEDLLGKQVIDFVNRFSSIFGGNSGAAKIGSIDKLANAGAFRSIAGTIFETAVTQATGSAVAQASRSGGQTAPIDYVSPNPKLRKLFNNIPGSYEAKIGDNPELVNSVADKAYRSGFFKKQGVFPGAKAKNMASGYIPNFAAIQDAVSRERAAGIPSSQIYLAQEQALTSANPMGIGVFNKKDEPTAGKRREQMKRKGFARGFVPNFAIEDPDIAANNLGSSLTALAAQVTSVGFAFQFSKDEYRQALKDFEVNTGKAAKGAQKLGIAAQSNALALSIAAPILGETIKNIVGQETKAGRVGGSIASGVGQIGSFAATGALIAGPGPQAAIGAGVGAALGALLTVPDIIKNALTDFPELAREAQKAQQKLTQFGEASSVLSRASELYADALSNSQTSVETLEKAQKSLADALNSVPTEYRDRLAEAVGTGTISEESAKINEELLRKTQIKNSSAELGRSTGEARLSGLKQTAAIPLDFVALNIINKVINRDLSSNISDQFDPKNVLKQEENVNAIQTVVTQSLTGGEFTPEVVKALEKIPLIATSQQLGGTGEVRPTGADNEFVTEVKNVDDLRKFLESTGKFDPSNIGDFLAQAEQDFEGTVSRINESVATTRNEAISTVDAIAKANAKQKEYLENVRKASAAIDAASSSLEKNIAIENLFKTAFENLQENIRGFSQNLQIEQKLTQPRQALENLIGSDKGPVRRLAAQEGLASIKETERSGIATAGIDFKGTVREILQKPFQDNIDKLRENLGSTKEGFKGDSTEIQSQTSDIIKNTTTEYQNLTSVMSRVEGYMSQFVNGQISTEQLLEQSKNELSNVGIDVTKGSQASDAVEKAVAELKVKSIQEQVKAFQQRAKLASETKQAILQSRIEQALGTFGGFEGFMNRPEEEQNYIQKITPDLGKIEKTRGSAAFRYTNEESIEEQEKQAPELGRAFANVYKELIAQSGGGFRDFLQQTIDQGIQQTGAESRDGKAGASARGGFDDIVRGRQQDLEQQLKLAGDQIKVTTDPVLKRDLQGFVDSIRKIPGGTKGIAQLQTQKELGVARQGDFAKLYGKYENEALNRLKDISPELAASLESAISLSDDPLVAEAQLQTSLQGELVGYMAPIQAAILQIANLGEGSVTDTGVSPTQIEAYKPKLTEEQQKKADELRTAQEKIAKKEADIKAKKTQEAALPKDNRTISEIEAATRAKRDQKYLQSPVAPRSRATGEKFGSMEEIDAEMNKALALGAINPEQKEYYGVLQNFKKNLDPTATTFGRQYDYNLDEKNRPVDTNSPMATTPATSQSFAQQEAAFGNNTSALTTLAGGIESLNSTIANFESSFANLNNIPAQTNAGTQSAAGAQQAANQSSNIGPFNVVVNSSQGDISLQLTTALEKLKSEILSLVNVKVAPTVPSSQSSPSTFSNG